MYLIPLVLERGRWRLQWEQTPKCLWSSVLCILDIDDTHTRDCQVNFTRLPSLSTSKDLARHFSHTAILPVAAWRLRIKLQFAFYFSVLCLLFSPWTDLTPRNWGCSPGALDSLSIFSESMWAMEMTVAATYQGRPMKEQAAIRTPTQNRSRW